MGSLAGLDTESIVVKRRTAAQSRGAASYTYSAGTTYPAAFRRLRPVEIAAFGRDASRSGASFYTDARPDGVPGTAPAIGDRVTFAGDDYEVIAPAQQVAGLGESYWVLATTLIQ